MLIRSEVEDRRAWDLTWPYTMFDGGLKAEQQEARFLRRLERKSDKNIDNSLLFVRVFADLSKCLFFDLDDPSTWAYDWPFMPLGWSRADQQEKRRVRRLDRKAAKRSRLPIINKPRMPGAWQKTPIPRGKRNRQKTLIPWKALPWRLHRFLGQKWLWVLVASILLHCLIHYWFLR